MDFIEKAFVANDIDLAQKVVMMQRNEYKQAMRRKRQDRENAESWNKKKEPQGYRETVRAAVHINLIERLIKMNRTEQ